MSDWKPRHNERDTTITFSGTKMRQYGFAHVFARESAFSELGSAARNMETENGFRIIRVHRMESLTFDAGTVSVIVFD